MASFESNLKATRNLVDLAVTSPHEEAPRVVFVGSIGVIRSALLLTFHRTLLTMSSYRSQDSGSFPGSSG